MGKWWFFCYGAKFLKLIKSDKTFLEKEPLENASKKESL